MWMTITYLSRSSLTVLLSALAAAACSSSSTHNRPDAQPDVNAATDATLAIPLDSAGLDASSESQGEAGQASQLTVSPASIDLDIVLPAVESPRQAITVTATSDLSDLAVFLLGDDLTLDGTSTCGKALAAGNACVVAITFLSPTVGAKSDSIVIVAGGQSVVVPVTAKVQAASRLVISPTSPWFPIGATMTFSVANASDTGVGPVIFTITGPNAADFTATATGCDFIAPVSTCAISVLFAPTVDFCNETASLVVTGPAPDFWTASVLLVGGFVSTPNPLLLTSSTSDLGSVAVGMTGPYSMFTLSYSPTCPRRLAIGPLAVTLSSAEFVITDDTCSTSVIPAGGTCAVSVGLRPTSAGGKSTILFVSAPSGENYAMELTGTGMSIVDAGPAEPMDSGLEQGEAGNIAIDGSTR